MALIGWIFIWLLGAALFLRFIAKSGWELVRRLARDPVGMAVPTLACIIVYSAPQMSDMYSALASRFTFDHPWRIIREFWLPVGVFWLGVQSWYWARAAFNARLGCRDDEVPEPQPWFQERGARLSLLPVTLIALSPLWLVIHNAWFAEAQPNEGAFDWLGRIDVLSVPWFGMVAAIGVSYGLGRLARYRRVRKVAALESKVAESQAAGIVMIPTALPDTRWRALIAAAPEGPRVAWAMLLIALFGVFFAQLGNVWITGGSAAMSFLALSCLVALGSFLLALLRDAADWVAGVLVNFTNLTMDIAYRAKVADVVGLLLLLLLPIFGSGLARNLGAYDVPVTVAAKADLPATATPGSDQGAGAGVQRDSFGRSTVGAAIKSYFDVCHSAETDPPAIIVATEGGASRSAAWTLAVLRQLDIQTGGYFGTHIFAITSVSGGSLGAVTYVMAQKKYPAAGVRAAADQLAFWEKPDVEAGIVSLAQRDLLAPSIARFFSLDLPLGTATRASALEASFDNMWHSKRGFDLADEDKTFLTLRTGQPCLPQLLLNGTDVGTGSRLLTASVAVDPELVIATAGPQIDRPFAGAIDLIAKRGGDISPAASVLNSARFPLISPAGHIPPLKGDANATDIDVIDGGVFENYGAETAHELAAAIEQARPGARPIIVLITNDMHGQDSLSVLDGECVGTWQPKGLLSRSTERAAQAVPDFISAIAGLYNTRGGHASAALAALQLSSCRPPAKGADTFGDGNWDLYRFDLPFPRSDKDEAAPMNWALNEATCHLMFEGAWDDKNVGWQLAGLTARLGQAPPNTPPPSPPDKNFCDS